MTGRLRGCVLLLFVVVGCELERELAIPSHGPSISTITPVEAPLADSTITIRVTGAYFTSGTRVLWEDHELVPFLRTAGELTVAVPADLYPEIGTYRLGVRHQGDAGPAYHRVFAVYREGPVPVILGVEPDPPFSTDTITLHGTGFRMPLTVRADDRALAGVSVMDSTRIRLALATAELRAGVHELRVVNNQDTTSRGGSSEARELFVLPSVDEVHQHLSARGSGFALPLSGSGFTPEVSLAWNGTPLAFEYISRNLIVARGDAALTMVADSAIISVLGADAAGFPQVDRSVAVVNRAAWRFGFHESVEIDAAAIAGTPGIDRVYVAVEAFGPGQHPTLIELDPFTRQVVRTWPLADRPLGVGLSADGAWLAVAVHGTEGTWDDPGIAVTIIDRDSGAVRSTSDLVWHWDPDHLIGVLPIAGGEGFLWYTAEEVVVSMPGDAERRTQAYDLFGEWSGEIEGVVENPDGTFLVYAFQSWEQRAGISRITPVSVTDYWIVDTGSSGGGLVRTMDGWFVLGRGTIVDPSRESWSWPPSLGSNAHALSGPVAGTDAIDPAWLVGHDWIRDLRPSVGQSGWRVDVPGLVSPRMPPVRWGEGGLAVAGAGRIDLVQLER